MTTTKKFTARDAKKRSMHEAKQNFWLEAANGFLAAGKSRTEASKLGNRALRLEVRAGRLPRGVSPRAG